MSAWSMIHGLAALVPGEVLLDDYYTAAGYPPALSRSGTYVIRESWEAHTFFAVKNPMPLDASSRPAEPSF